MKENGYSVQKFNDNFSHGIPDLFVTDLGWVELKIIGGEVKGPQVMWAKKFHRDNLPVYLAFPGTTGVFLLKDVLPGIVSRTWLAHHSS